MALAIAKNFEREATTISSKAFIPWVSDRVSTELRGAKPAELQAINRAFLFCVLKTGKYLWTAAALVCPLKLADLDALITVDLPRCSVKQLWVQGSIFPRQFGILLVFSGKEICKPLGPCKDIPIVAY
jgi:hypothetical protein